MKVIVDNRKARFDYQTFDVYEAGIELLGTEVKSLREGRANLRDAYATVKGGQVFLMGAHIAPYERGSAFSVHDPTRTRRLLLHRREIAELAGQGRERGMTLVPLRLYFNGRGRAKVEIAVAKGRKRYDKRRQIVDREAKRAIARAMRSRR